MSALLKEVLLTVILVSVVIALIALVRPHAHPRSGVSPDGPAVACRANGRIVPCQP